MSTRQRLAPPIAVSTTDGFRVLRPEAIDWIEADGNHVQLRVGGTSYPIRATFRETLERLGGRFRQVHRGYAVNLARLESIHPNGDGGWVVVLSTGAQLPLGRSYRRHLFAALTQL